MQNQQPKVDNANKNNNNDNRTLSIRPFFSGRTYLILKIPPRIHNRDIFIITKSPPEQYSNSKFESGEIGEEPKPLSEYENTIVVFDDLLGSSNSR